MPNDKIDQSQLFTRTQKAFSVEKLMTNMMKDSKLDDTFNNSKSYFLKYFAKALDSYYYEYEPSEDDDEGTIQNINEKQMSSIWEKIPTINYTDSNNKPQKFSLKKWFTTEHYLTYKINSDPRVERFYESKKTGQNYINLSKGFLHKEKKHFESFPKNVKKDVKTILDHIEKVWCSNEKDDFEYVLSWLSSACTGHKMPTALFLKSAEGTGKSLIVSFLITYVIGISLGLITPRPEQLMKFNGQLLGKILVCLEELPSTSKNSWYSISDYLKDLITGSRLDIEKKYQDMIQTVNLISLIIITNNENCIRFGKDARRYMMCDISHDVVGNTEYFKILSEACNKEAGEAMFWYFMEHYEKKPTWEPSVIPLTLSKLEMKDKNITPLLSFIKEKFVVVQKDIADNNSKHHMILVNNMKDAFNNWSGEDPVSSKTFNMYLRSDIPIIKIVPYGKENKLHVQPVKFNTLLKFYENKGFWDSKYDEFIGNKKVISKSQEPEEAQKPQESNEDINQLKDQIATLKAQIAMLQPSRKPETVFMFNDEVGEMRPKYSTLDKLSCSAKQLRSAIEDGIVEVEEIRPKKKIKQIKFIESDSESGMDDDQVLSIINKKN